MHLPKEDQYEVITTIKDIGEYAKRNNRPVILIAANFEKAFDSFNPTFLVKVLEKFNFGTCFFARDLDLFYKPIKMRVEQWFCHQFFLCLPWSQTR